MLGLKNVEQLTEAKLVKEVRHFMELKGALQGTQYPFTVPDSWPNKSSPHLILFLGPSFISFLYLQQLLPSALIHSFFMNVAFYTILLLPMHAILLVLNSTSIPLSNIFKRHGMTSQKFV